MADAAGLRFTGKAGGLLFAWVGEGGGTLCLRGENDAGGAVTLVPPRSYSRPAAWGKAAALAGPGVWEVRLGPGREVSFAVEAEGEVYPFIVPGPGIVPSHFPQPQPTLLFDRGGDVTVWIDVPEDLPRVTLAAWMPPGHGARLTLEDSEARELTWLPERPSAYRIAEVDAVGRDGWWRLRVARQRREFRLTVWEGLPLFLARPPGRLPYGRVICSARGDGRRSLDARFEYVRGGERLALRDQPAGEAAVLHVLPGECEVRASRGLEFQPANRTFRIKPGRCKKASFRLRRVLTPEPGWVCGDHHLHSCFEDGGQTPRAVARAGRAAGLSHLFLTDEPEPLGPAGLQDFDEPGRFLALPGEEAATDAVHMNFLNTRHSVRQASRTVADWLEDAAAQATAEHPTAAMLNHPAHLPDPQRRHGYFRSWWVADEHESVGLVENFDFASWFERLNRGRRLTGLWTTDSHDAAFLPPGRKRTYVYVGEELAEPSLMAALRAGRCFNTREPGAILTLTVNGARMGETARPDAEGAVTVEVACQAACPIERVELIVNGHTAGVWPGRRRRQLQATSRLKAAKMRWLLARAFLIEPPWPKDGHTMEALMASGCAAFTNPVWVEQAE